MQAAFHVEHSKFQPLLNCPILTVRVLTKSIFAFVGKYRKIPNLLQYVSLQKEDVVCIASHLTDVLQSGTSSNSTIFSSVEEILHSLQSLTSYPSNIKHCGLLLLLDTLISTCSFGDKTVARLAMETLWNLSFDPNVALAIINHESAIHTLQKLVFDSSLAASILWTLGHGKALSKSRICMAYNLKYACVCIQW